MEAQSIAGEGRIDLPAETVQLRLLPRPRKASPISTAATVQVTGPLSAPSVTVEKRSLVTSSTAALVLRRLAPYYDPKALDEK